jgi:hypothetical protein
VVINGCSITTNGDASVGYGIVTVAGANNYTISGNLIRDNGQGSILDNGGPNKSVVNNLDGSTVLSYETGTWTPTLRGDGATSGQTYSKQRGDYVRIGDLVTASFDVILTNKGTTSGSLSVYGLPFEALAEADARWVGAAQWSNMAANLVYVNLLWSNAVANRMLVIGSPSAAASAIALDVATYLGNSTRVIGTITYRRAP